MGSKIAVDVRTMPAAPHTAKNVHRIVHERGDVTVMFHKPPAFRRDCFSGVVGRATLPVKCGIGALRRVTDNGVSNLAENQYKSAKNVKFAYGREHME